MERIMGPHAVSGSATSTDASQFTIQELLSKGRPSEAEVEAENTRLKIEVNRMADRQREVMELLNCKSADRLVHDLRNLINEVNLYRQLIENTEE